MSSINIKEVLKDMRQINNKHFKLLLHIYYLMKYGLSDYSFCYTRAKALQDSCFKFLEDYEVKLKQSDISDKKTDKVIAQTQKIGNFAQKVVSGIEAYGTLTPVLSYHMVRARAGGVERVKSNSFVANIEEEVIELMFDNEGKGKDDEDYEEIEIEIVSDEEVGEFVEQYKNNEL